MISDSPMVLILLLLVLTALGVVIGYCMALIIVKNSARRAIEDARVEFMHDESQTTDMVLDDAMRDFNSPHAANGQAYDRTAAERERVLLEKSRGQAQHIQNLESQLVSLEDQQQKLQRHFASYKENKDRELVLAQNASSSRANTDDLPTLSRKVDPQTGAVAEAKSLHEKVSKGAASRTKRKFGVLHQTLSPELDIPTLSESELPDLADELEFNVAGSERGGTKRGG